MALPCSTLLFAPQLPTARHQLAPFHFSRATCHQPAFVWMSASPPSRPSDDMPNFDDSNLPYARFSEFSSSNGDTAVQDDLVREVMWQATRLATTRSMESTIDEEIDAVSGLLSDMYSRGKRNITRRNEEAARRASIENISKWNQHLMQRHKESKKQKEIILEQLQMVETLLRRETRKSNRTKSSWRRKSKSSSSVSNVSASNEPFASQILKIPSTQAIILSVLFCSIAMNTFEQIASQENGPAQLAHYAGFSALFILTTGYMQALRSAYKKSASQLKSRGIFIDE